jgi:hypothetical protein
MVVHRLHSIDHGYCNIAHPGSTAKSPTLALSTSTNRQNLQNEKDEVTVFFFFFWEGLSLQAKQRSGPPKKPRACLIRVFGKSG